MPAKARKGFKNGHTNRSSLVKMQTNKNIIKPCFLEAASHEALMFQAGRNWLPRFQNGCQQKFPLARKVKSAGADFGLLTLRPETFRWHQPPIFALFCPQAQVNQGLKNALFASIGKKHYRRELKQAIIKRSRGWLKQQQRRLTASNQGETIASVKMKINKLPLRT